MLIRMLIDMPGTRDGEPWPAKGEAVELATATAAHLVASGVAEQVTDEAPPRRTKGGGRRGTQHSS